MMDGVPSCRRCGVNNADEARFCQQCGLELRRAEQQRFRRTVTMLFADLVGSTSLGERLDPEALSAVLTTYFGSSRRIIESHGGTVEKFIGDAIVAVFGLPYAHEDDALRAVRSAWEIQQEIARLNPEFTAQHGVGLAVRMGVNSGEVAGSGRGLEDNFVFGDTANTAARLEQHAGPGEILLGISTYRLVRSQVMAEPVAPLSVKGKAAPLDARRLLSVVDLPSGSEGADGAFVGRQKELDVLVSHFAAVMAAARARVVTVLGDAGMGKSRLVQRFLEELPPHVRVLSGRCLPYGEGITYWPLHEIVRAVAGIDDQDSPAEARSKLAALCGDGGDEARAVEKLGEAIGVLDTGASAAEIAWAAETLLQSWSRPGPLVVVLEDIHWAEPTFLGLVEHLSHSLGDATVLIVCLGRPELIDAAPAWEHDQLRPVVRLAPLESSEGSHLLTALFEGVNPEPVLEQRLMGASGGNPLFLGQLASMFLEQGLIARVGPAMVATTDVAAVVPASIQALLAARIDRLPDAEAVVLCRAAVFSVEFHLDDLVGLVPGDLQGDLAAVTDQLCRRGFLDRPDPRSPTSFRWRHVLIRDVAYGQLTKQDRATLHETVATRKLSRAGERLAEYDELVGYHLEQAFRFRSDLRSLKTPTAEDWELAHVAAGCLERAGRRAVARGDVFAAAGLLGRAAALMRPHDAGRPRVLADLGQALLEGGRLDEAASRFREVSGDDGADSLSRSLADVCLDQLALQVDSPGPEATAAILNRARHAMARFSDHDDDTAALRAGWLVFLTSMTLGRSSAALEAVERLMIAGGTGDLLAWRLPGMLAMALAWGSTPVADALRRTGALRQQLRGNPSAEPYFLPHHSYLLALDGDIDGARQALAQMRQIVESLGQRLLIWSAWAQGVGRVELAAGEPARAEQGLREGYEALCDIGERGSASTLAGQLALVLIEQERWEDAADMVEQCHKAADEADALSQILWRTAWARVLARGGDRNRATQLAAEATDLAMRTEWPNVQGDVLLDQARVLEAVAEGEQAVDAVRHALAIYHAKGNRAGGHRARSRLDALATGAL